MTPEDLALPLLCRSWPSGEPGRPPVVPGVTLRILRQVFPGSFYRQEWFDGEAFMDTPHPIPGRGGVLPTQILTASPGLLRESADIIDVAIAPHELPLAVELAALYLHAPAAPCWRRYLWCRDTDAQGQRVYVGCNGHGLEIHRHLHLTDRWGIPIWP